MTLSEIIENSLLPTIYKRCYPIKKETIKGIFYGNKEYQKTRNPLAKNSFEGILNNDVFCSDINKIIPSDIEEEIKSLCSKYLSSKKTIVKVVEELVNLLKQKYDITINLKVPEFDFENTIERQLYLIKFLHHDEQHTFNQACEHLWMYSREKLLDDIGDIKKGLSFLGKGISLEIDRNNNEITSFPTGHPIILVEDMSQIFIQLEGLRKMAKGSTKTYAERTAATIWNQLSEYAKQRIFFVIEKIYESDSEFYQSLEKMDNDDIFFDEDSLSRVKGSTSLINYLKNEYDFYLVYYDINKNVIVRHSKRNKGKKVTFDTYHLIDYDTAQEFTVNESDIIGCVRRKDELYKLI